MQWYPKRELFTSAVDTSARSRPLPQRAPGLAPEQLLGEAHLSLHHLDDPRGHSVAATTRKKKVFVSESPLQPHLCVWTRRFCKDMQKGSPSSPSTPPTGSEQLQVDWASLQGTESLRGTLSWCLYQKRTSVIPCFSHLPCKRVQNFINLLILLTTPLLRE